MLNIPKHFFQKAKTIQENSKVSSIGSVIYEIVSCMKTINIKNISNWKKKWCHQVCNMSAIESANGGWSINRLRIIKSTLFHFLVSNKVFFFFSPGNWCAIWGTKSDISLQMKEPSISQSLFEAISIFSAANN